MRPENFVRSYNRYPNKIKIIKKSKKIEKNISKNRSISFDHGEVP